MLYSFKVIALGDEQCHNMGLFLKICESFTGILLFMN